jgi:hypothetical protein
VLGLAACGAVDSRSISMASVNRGDLAAMVVPKRELGVTARRLDRDEDSGVSDNAAGAEDTIDPKDDAADLRRAGRIEGYDLYYTDSTPTTATEKAGARRHVRGALPRDAGSAQRYMTKQLRAYDDAEGTKEDEILLRRVRHYAVHDLGDDEDGVELSLEYEKDKARFWVVAFGVDRVVATANVFRTDELPGEDYSRDLARALRNRIMQAAGNEE